MSAHWLVASFKIEIGSPKKGLLQFTPNFITNHCSDCYYKLLQILLQIALVQLLQITPKFITIYCSITNYCKNLLQITPVLQITKLLQITALQRTTHTAEKCLSAENSS